MALNAYVTPDGGEMSWAQAMQAEAAGVAPQVEMNPVLLKPRAGGASQIVHARAGARPVGVHRAARALASQKMMVPASNFLS
jgi:adenosylcobyric acid synthase